MDPDHACIRAQELCASGAGAEAARVLVAAIRAAPRAVQCYRALAEVHRALGRRAARALALEQVALLEPLDACHWRALGEARQDCGEPDAAYRANARAAELDTTPEHLAAAFQSALLAQRWSDAVLHCEDLQNRHGNSPLAALVNGQSHQARGHLAEARLAYRMALGHSTTHARAFLALTELGDLEPGDDTVRSVLRADRGTLPPSERVPLEFGLARIFSYAGDIERAFEHLTRGNEAAARAAGAGTALDAPALEPAPARQLPSLPIALRPIFIIGLPRSGSTLIEQMLGQHPKVAAGGELPLGPECEARWRRLRFDAELKGAPDLQQPREREILHQVRERYVDGLFERGLDAPVVTDKLPGNYLRLPLLRVLFPNAIFIHVQRDPLAHCWSLFSANLPFKHPDLCALDRLPALFAAYANRIALLKRTHAAAIYELSYERLVAEPEGELRALLAACELDWNPACLEFHTSGRVVLTASGLQVRRPIYQDAIAGWKPFQARLGPLIEGLARNRA